MKTKLTLTAVTAAILAACGGGGETSSSPTQTVVPASQATSTAVATPAPSSATVVSASPASSPSPAASPAPASSVAAPPVSASPPPASSPAPAPAPIEWPVNKAIIAGFSGSWTAPARSFVFVNEQFNRYTALTTAAPNSSVRYPWSLQNGAFSVAGMEQYSGANRTRVCLAFAGGTIAPPPELAKVGDTGDLLACRWLVINGDFTGEQSTIVWWVQPSKLAGRALVCLATLEEPSRGVCFRTDQSGNVDPAKLPWMEE